MQSKKKNVMFRLDDEDLRILEDFQFPNRIPNRSEALRQLLRRYSGERAKHKRAFDWLPGTMGKVGS